MISRSFKTEKALDNPHKVELHQLYNDESAQLMHITLQPGEKLLPHKTPVDVAFYVLEGTPTIHIGDKEETFEKDTLIESPERITHWLSNQSETVARVLVLKAPRPTTSTQLL